MKVSERRQRRARPLRAGAAIGSSGDFLERAQELVRRKVDVLAIDSAHAHSRRVMDAIAAVKNAFPDVEILAGNVATYEGARDLIDLGVDGIKVGVGPRFDLHHARRQRRGCPANYCYRRVRESHQGHGCTVDRGRRYQVFRRHL